MILSYVPDGKAGGLRAAAELAAGWLGAGPQRGKVLQSLSGLRKSIFTPQYQYGLLAKSVRTQVLA